MAEINLHNYEEYYLDYLEGNLSADKVAEIEIFLMAHPELNLDSGLPSFSFEEETVLESGFKNQLKKTDFKGEINNDTIDDFLIADLEGQLDSSSKARLSAAVLANVNWQKTEKLYQHTKLQADLNHTYPNKRELKKTRVIALKPMIQMLAAACVVSFAVILFDGESSYKLENGVLQGEYSLPKLNSPAATASITEENKPERPVTQKDGTARGLQVNIASREFTVDRLALQANSSPSLPTSIERSSISFKEMPIESIEEKNNTTSDYALAMKDQAKPITRALSDAIKQEVVYKKGTNTSVERSGFYIKIGKFELYNNRKIKPKD